MSGRREETDELGDVPGPCCAPRVISWTFTAAAGGGQASRDAVWWAKRHLQYTNLIQLHHWQSFVPQGQEDAQADGDAGK